ncbi:MAG: hypothetical protein LBQ86_09190 [Holophagales bacterium]|jgi:hypothetical protein|nr:hypothetical protein [Holophagales bacterium]
MYLHAIIFCSFIYVFASAQEIQEAETPFQAENLTETDNETLKSTDGFILRPKPWWLRASTKEWQWVAINPKVYYPRHLDPLKYPAIIEHEKIHLAQQKNIGKYKWLFKYIVSKKFRFEQEMEPIVVEISNTPMEGRRRLVIKYASSLSGAPYSKAAKTFDFALEGILSKAAEMGVALD